MTRDEFIAHLLLVFHPKSIAPEGTWFERYRRVTAYDMAVWINIENRVLIKYDLDPPKATGWVHHKDSLTFAEAWEFITAFINEHPDK